jgi:hypothetical protein
MAIAKWNPFGTQAAAVAAEAPKPQHVQATPADGKRFGLENVRLSFQTVLVYVCITECSVDHVVWQYLVRRYIFIVRCVAHSCYKLRQLCPPSSVFLQSVPRACAPISRSNPRSASETCSDCGRRSYTVGKYTVTKHVRLCHSTQARTQDDSRIITHKWHHSFPSSTYTHISSDIVFRSPIPVRPYLLQSCEQRHYCSARLHRETKGCELGISEHEPSRRSRISEFSVEQDSRRNDGGQEAATAGDPVRRRL